MNDTNTSVIAEFAAAVKNLTSSQHSTAGEILDLVHSAPTGALLDFIESYQNMKDYAPPHPNASLVHGAAVDELKRRRTNPDSRLGVDDLIQDQRAYYERKNRVMARVMKFIG